MKRFMAAIMATATIGGVSAAQNAKADDGMVFIKGGTFTSRCFAACKARLL